MVKSIITNLSGFDLLEIFIHPNESVLVKSDTQLVHNNHLTVSPGTGKGLFQAFSSSSPFMNKIENATVNTYSVSISPILPGSIKPIEIRPNESWIIASHVYLASTSNLSMSNKFMLNVSNLFSENGIFFMNFTAPPDSVGVVWIHSLGGTYTRNLSETSNFRAHCGLFMAAPAKVFMNIRTVGNGELGSTAIKGHGLMMDFSKCGNRGSVYMQTANVQEFMFKIAKQIHEKPENEQVEAKPASGVVGWMSGKGIDPEKATDTATPMMGDIAIKYRYKNQLPVRRSTRRKGT